MPVEDMVFELQQTTTVKAFIRSVCWSPELRLFVAVGSDGSNYGIFYTSPDGKAWTLKHTATAVSLIQSVCWSPELGLFAAVGYNNATNYYRRVYTSPDGITWTARLNDSVYGLLTSVCWSPELRLFVAVGYNASFYGLYFNSADGITWTLRQTNTGNSRMRSVCWSPKLGLFAAVGFNAANNSVFYTSANGVSWAVKQTNTKSSYMQSVCWSQELELFVAVGYSPSVNSEFYTSIDGTKWTLELTATIYSSIIGVCWSPELGLFIAVGYNAAPYYGLFFTSPDGKAWTLRQTNTETGIIMSVCWSSELNRAVTAGYDNTTLFGVFYSHEASLAPPAIPPGITAQPSNKTVTEGQTVTFNITATSDSGALKYQWQNDTGSGFNDIPGATAATYTTPATTMSMNGWKYRVLVGNDADTQTVSDAATLTVEALFIPVTGITGVPSGTVAGTPLTLTGTVNPSDATNKTIAWSVSPNNMLSGVTVNSAVLSATMAGTAKIRATVVNGLANGTNYTQDFDITVTAAFVAVTEITGLPMEAKTGEPLALTGTVAPANATNKTIAWSVKTNGGTGAAISGNILTAANAGTVTVTATIANGLSASSDYKQDFAVSVEAAEEPPIEPPVELPKGYIKAFLPHYTARRPFAYIKVKESR